MNLLEYENTQFPNLWTEEEIKISKGKIKTEIFKNNKENEKEIIFGWDDEEPPRYDLYAGRYFPPIY